MQNILPFFFIVAVYVIFGRLLQSVYYMLHSSVCGWGE